MPRSVAEVRLDDHAVCRYVLFLEGEPDGYTDDESGGLIGSGLGSWIGSSETAIGGIEILGTRRIRGGLIVPESVTFANEPKTGELVPAPATFEILDVDDTLSYLFASEGKESVELIERIPPGTTALGTGVTIYGGATTNPRGRYVGPERIGPSGQRRFCPALPFSLIGFDHAVGEHQPPVLISDESIEFAGRMAALYRVYKVRPELDDSDPTAWALWGAAEAAGDRVWWGTMRDAGNVSGSGRWSIACHGPDALTRKTLGTRNTSRWMRINADPVLSDEQRYVGIGFRTQTFAGEQTHYQGSNWAHQFSSTDGRAELAADLDEWIEDAMDGTSVNSRAASDLFEDWETGAAVPFNPDAGVYQNGVFFVSRVGFAENLALAFGTLMIAMHELAWMRFGWEPWRQHLDGNVFSDLTRCRFQKLEAGDDFTPLGDGIVPGDGYWLAYFDTITPGASTWDSDFYANSGGGPREWHPMHTSSVFVLDNHGGQLLRLIDQGPTDVYLEGSPTGGVDSALHEIDGTPVEYGRWFALRGKRIRVTDDPETEEIEVSEPEDLRLVAFGEWVEGATYGSIGVGSGFVPALYLSRFESPRTFGWNNRHIGEPWAGKTSGKGIIEIAPLNTYHYQRGSKPFEVAPSVWLQVMLSTGTAAGYDAPHDEGPDFTGGDNQTLVPGLDFQDCELADMGLGIPQQIVASASEVYAAFDTVPGGATGALNRVRMAYIGPYQAADVLESLMRPRRMCWSLHGKQFGVFKLGPVSPEDADITLLEDDLYGPPGEPAAVIPDQSMRATGQLDRVDLSYRNDPETGKPVLTSQYPALDAQARQRTGELVESITDHGLCPPWFGSPAHQAAAVGVGDWTEPFRDLWAREAATFFAARHYTLSTTVSRPKGQDIMPGTSAAITNPWPVSPSGGRGIVGATGRATSVTHMLRGPQGGCARVEWIVFAGQPVVHYSPAVLLSRVTSDTVYWYDYTGIDADGRGFVEPDWSETGGTMEVDLYQRTGNTWTLAFSAGVVSADLAARSAVLDAAPGSAILRDKDTWMVARGWADQNANDWPRVIYGVQADTDQTVGDGTTKAPAFVG